MDTTDRTREAKIRAESKRANEYLAQFYNEDGTFKGDDFEPTPIKVPKKTAMEKYQEEESATGPFSNRSLRMAEQRGGHKSVEDVRSFEEQRIKDFLEAMANTRSAPLTLAQRIMVAVCKRHRIRVALMRSKGRQHHLAMARRECAYMLYTRTSLSLTQIGRVMDRHHTTVLYCVRAYAKAHGLDYEKERERECLTGQKV